MEKIYKQIKVKYELWERLRNLAYDNRMSIPAFIKTLLDDRANKS